MEFISKHWPALIGLAAVGALAYGQFNFMAQTITPETYKQFAVNEAKQACARQLHSYIDDARFCMQTKNDLAECLKRPATE